MIKKTFRPLLILHFLSLVESFVEPPAVNPDPAWKPILCSPAPPLKIAATTLPGNPIPAVSVPG
jgi:hypothetical protein